MDHVVSRPARYAFNGLWMLDHALGREAVDRVAPSARGAVRARVGRELTALPTGQLSPIPRRADLDAETFLREHVDTDQPVVLAGAARGWVAAKRWTFPFFIERFGHEPVQLINAGFDDDDAPPGGPERPLGAVLREVLEGSQEYPRFLPLLDRYPELWRDLDLDWLHARRGPRARRLKWNTQLFIGGPGSNTALHCAIGSNLFVQLQGTKRWVIASPAYTPALDVELSRSPYFFSRVDLEAPDLARFPWLAGVRGWVAELEPGDVLYNPPFFWHQVRNTAHSVSVGIRYYDPLVMSRISATMTALTLLATQPPIWTAARLKGDFGRIFSGRWRTEVP